jgi:sialate O-acetylesterase
MLSLYKVFSSHAVVQREKPVVFSGYGAVAHAPIKGVFAGVEALGMSAADGTWTLTFPALAAGGPYELVVTCGDESVTLTDLLVGEVWLCSGQSNMEMPVYAHTSWCYPGEKEAAEAAAANYPQIRFFDYTNLKRIAPYAPCDDAHAGEWQLCTPENIREFSACAYYFGRKLYRDLNVPIGLISTSWGGTGIEAWTSKRMFDRYHWLDYNTYNNIVNHEEIEASKQEIMGAAVNAIRQWCVRFDAFGVASSAWLQEKLDDITGWQKALNTPLPPPSNRSSLPIAMPKELEEDRQGKSRIVLPKRGRYVVRVEFELSDVDAQGGYSFEGMVVNDCDRTYVNGVEIGRTEPSASEYWNAERRYAIGQGVLHVGRNTLAIVADNHFGEGAVNLLACVIKAQTGFSVAAPVVDSAVMRTVFTVPENFDTRPDMPMWPVLDGSSPNYPSTLYNGMLYCFRRYTIRGVLWYQGCHNNGCQSYYNMHRMLIEDMRELWDDKDLPFYLVQLASYHQNTPEKPLTDAQIAEIEAHPPVFAPFALIREIQATIRDEMPHTGMACTFDVGEHSNIHPHDKTTVGERLALLAERDIYHFNIEAEGPQFAGWRREGNVTRVFFKHAHGLHTTDGKAPLAFACMSRTGELFCANAVIDGETIVLSCPQCDEPEAVRYAFTGYCRVNLVNDADLPAEPFRSDAINYKKAFA